MHMKKASDNGITGCCELAKILAGITDDFHIYEDKSNKEEKMKKRLRKVRAISFYIILGLGFIAAFNCYALDTVTSTKQIPRVAFPDKKVADLNALKWRFIGPMTGTRGSAVVGHPADKNVFFHGAGNGLWKTTDAGDTWLEVGDKAFKKG